MECNKCVYQDNCKQPNKDKPACMLLARYNRIYKAAHVPKRYWECNCNNLPTKNDNPNSYAATIRYCDNVLKLVNKGVNVLYYSQPTPTNTLGTGIGKTTSACTILNQYIKEYVFHTVKQSIPIDTIPAYFLSCSELQNVYNSQFKTDDGAAKYKVIKQFAKESSLLVLDDIALRGCSEGFSCELYEIINYRDSEVKATIYTSNVNVNDLDKVLDSRITSRITSNCGLLIMSGEDKRGVCL